MKPSHRRRVNRSLGTLSLRSPTNHLTIKVDVMTVDPFKPSSHCLDLMLQSRSLLVLIYSILFHSRHMIDS